MAKKKGKQSGVRMGLKSAIKRAPHRAVKKAALDAAAPASSPPPSLPPPAHTIVSYLRQKQKKKKNPKPTTTIMTGTVTPTMAAAPTIKSEIMEDFRPKFNDIKELAKNSPGLALSCMSVETLEKAGLAKDGLPGYGSYDQTPGAGKGVAAGVDQGKANAAAAGMKGAFGKAAMKPQTGIKPLAPKAPAAGTPKPPKGPTAQMAPKTPKGMAGAPMGKEEKGVHKPFMGNKDSGTSSAGYEVRDSKLSDEAYRNKKIAGAKDKHNKVLTELRNQPKPALGKEEKGKEIKRPDGPQVSAGGGKNFPVKEHKESGKEGLNIVTPPNGTKKCEYCGPNSMIKEELAQPFKPKFAKFDPEANAEAPKTDDDTADKSAPVLGGY